MGARRRGMERRWNVTPRRPDHSASPLTIVAAFDPGKSLGFDLMEENDVGRVLAAVVARRRVPMSILLFLLFGLIVGALARFIVHGKDPGGWVVSMVLGVLGSFLGGFLGRSLGWYHEGEPAGFFMSLVGAVIVVAIFHAVTKRRAWA